MRHDLVNEGLVYVFTGEGKGKTSAALGVVLRMLLGGKRVVWVSWYKSREWKISEMGLERMFPKQVKSYWNGKGFYIKEPGEVVNGVRTAKVNKAVVRDSVTVDEHRQSAEENLEIVKRELSLEHRPDILVMDEVIVAINDGLLREEAVVDLIGRRGETHMILTGRGASQTLQGVADLVTDMQNKKHPFDSGKLATRGLDY